MSSGASSSTSHAQLPLVQALIQSGATVDDLLDTYDIDPEAVLEYMREQKREALSLIHI